MNSRSLQETRQFFYTVWQKQLSNTMMTALEHQILQVMLEHPDYHSLFNDSENQTKTWFPDLGETNPFLHLGLHLAVREQVQTNRPRGIKKVFQRLLKKTGCPLASEHLIMEKLADALWQAKKNQTMPDETWYLQELMLL